MGKPPESIGETLEIERRARETNFAAACNCQRELSASRERERELRRELRSLHFFLEAVATVYRKQEDVSMAVEVENVLRNSKRVLGASGGGEGEAK